MRGETTDAQRAILHDRLVPELAAMLGDRPLPDNPDELEQIAATLLVPLQLPEMPPEVPAAFLGAIERRRDAGAAGILAAIAVVAGEPLAGQARAAAERLACDGVASPATRRLGTLAVREAVRLDGGEAELLVVLLRRPGARKLQVAVLGIEHRETGGALIECRLTPPLGAADAGAFVNGEAAKEGAPASEPIATAELAARAVAAARRAVDAGVALGHEAAIALPLVARALTGDPLGLPRPEVLPPWEDDDGELIVDPAEDEDGFHKVMELLLDELEEYATAAYPAGSAVWRHGDFVASSMLEWKGGYADGRLGRWTGDDLAEYLLDYFPRKVSVDEETLDAVPECAIAFLRLLDTRGSLSGEPLEHLEEVCAALRHDFRERARDPATWGLAKSMVMQMHAEEIDPGDPGAVEAWIAGFNDRSRAERDAVVGGAVDRMLTGAQPPPVGGRAPAPGRRTQRKAQPAARKRNRRRG